MSIELMKQALETLEGMASDLGKFEIEVPAIAVVRQAIAEAEKQEQGEPVTFEEWLSKQHGDPEEIGFLQALRIAYISGQDSITTPQQRKPLTDWQITEIYTEWECKKGTSWADLIRAIEAAHGIKE